MGGVVGLEASVPTCREVKEAWLLAEVPGEGYCLVQQLHQAKVPERLLLVVPLPLQEQKVQSLVALGIAIEYAVQAAAEEILVVPVGRAGRLAAGLVLHQEV